MFIIYFKFWSSIELLFAITCNLKTLSEILEDTTGIVLESACFEASSIRKTATSLGLRTEASARYEKSLDPNMSETATLRFIKLLQDEVNNK